MRPAELRRLLREAGFELTRGGSHDLYRKGRWQVPLSRGNKPMGNRLVKLTLVTIKRATA